MRDPRDPLGGHEPRDVPLQRRLRRLRSPSRWRAPTATRCTSRSAAGVSNFFSNIQDIFIGVNNLLQGKLQDGVEDWARFAFNSTIGLVGIHDVASDMGIEKHNEDFGQTFGRWGADAGPYLILPFLGSSTLRDTVGLALDWYFEPLAEARPIALRNSLYALYFVNTRAELLEASDLLEEAALDRYIFQRDAYLQRRRSLIYDGSPPREREEVNETPEPAVKQR